MGSTKTGAGRLFPFVALPALAALLSTQRDRMRAIERERGVVVPHVFHRFGKPISSFREAWVRACERAGVEGRLVHDLRRSGARRLVRSGVPERTAMALMGHRTRSIFDRYCITNESDLADGVKKLAFKAVEPVEARRVVAIAGSKDARRSTEPARFAAPPPDAADVPIA